MEMLSCQLNKLSDIPLYEQLYLYIKKEIIKGRIQYGAKLPSKRKLSDFLKISRNTIETAYEQLIAEGYVEAFPRKGYFVMAYEDLEYVQMGNRVQKNTETTQENIRYNFHPSSIDTENFPFPIWRRYVKNLINKENHSLLLLGNSQGESELREEIAHYLYHARGVQCSPGQIIVGAGIEILLQQLLILFNEKMVYGVEDPGYHLILQTLKFFQNEIYPIEVDEEGIKVETIRHKNINVIYLSPSHQFPYGTVLSINRRNKLLKWASEDKNRYIIEDDYDSEFRYSGKSIPSLQSMDYSEKVIYLGTFSKSLMPSIRISYMVLPRLLLQQYKEKLSFYHSSSVSRIDQHILANFLKNGDFERHLNRMRKIYRRKLEKVLELLNPYRDKLSIIGEHSGLHIVLVVNNGMSEEDLVQRAAKAGMKVYPTSTYSLEKKMKKYPEIILGFAGISEEELKDAIQSLIKCWGF
ncbi:PLP-dependent aminotransferase family protein [Priestia endophytica]|uniref:MocR-like pyridoxine biosynthesis transcription factor PdxR n=1 Tax=Priestia endophytica TaxID=135735 RepID=UPI000DCA7F9C|nr:PLP-dependent aminotransferase family protein [Priestia endophytica]RAS86401.1 GntR family transcriptional regulator [Priestia endophytica]